MGRERNPRRDEALKLYLKSEGEMQPKEIADLLHVPASRVRKWKSEDKWVEELAKPPEKRSVPKKRMGAPFGNRNAVGNKGGNGPPKGSRNAAGCGKSHIGKPSPALKTGEHAVIWIDQLDKEEQALLYGSVDVEPIKTLDEDIRLLSIRERRMLKIRANLLANPEIEEEIHGYFDKEGKPKPKNFVRKKSPVIDRLINLEEALTRVQEKRIRASESMHKFVEDANKNGPGKDIKITVVRKEVDI
ncbi:MAG: phage terminase small subunit [Selenomonadaceae bacterium]|nr:phage terminase small subunit [Selenomonadaceae bacterium]MDY3916908.1 phage terminase small subunit [Selenomonadaceae bacterium]